MRKIATALLLTMMAAPASAEPTGDQMIQLLDKGSQAALDSLNATSNGIEWTQVVSVRKGNKKLWCPPPNLGITADQKASMLRQYLTANPDQGKYPAALLMVMAYIYTFPCK